ncbi:hypothetical protein AMTRI_Chr11g101620 [Amborella trichopoda]
MILEWVPNSIHETIVQWNLLINLPPSYLKANCCLCYSHSLISLSNPFFKESHVCENLVQSSLSFYLLCFSKALPFPAKTTAKTIDWPVGVVVYHNGWPYKMLYTCLNVRRYMD